MIIKLQVESEVPLYEQIVQQILEGIATKQLRPGEPLPSVRSLAADVGINFLTVNKAYQILKEKGFIRIHRQKGVVIQPNAFPQADPAYLQELEQRLRPLIVEAVCRGMSAEQFVEQNRRIFTSLKKEES